MSTSSSQIPSRKPVIHYEKPTQSRDSSMDSRTSSGSRTSAGYYSPRETTSSNPRYTMREDVERSRVPDNARHEVTTARHGNVSIHNQGSLGYDKYAPVTSDAKYEDYEQHERERRRYEQFTKAKK